MAAPTTGHRATDHMRTIALVEIALDVAQDTLKPGGAFVGKVFQGGATGELLPRLKKTFETSSMSSRPPAAPNRWSFIWCAWLSRNYRPFFLKGRGYRVRLGPDRVSFDDRTRRIAAGDLVHCGHPTLEKDCRRLRHRVGFCFSPSES